MSLIQFNDVIPFIKDTAILDIWSRDYFRDVAEQIQTVSG